MKYLVVIEKGPTGFGAYVPDLPGCVAVATRPTSASCVVRGRGCLPRPRACSRRGRTRPIRMTETRTNTPACPNAATPRTASTAATNAAMPTLRRNSAMLADSPARARTPTRTHAHHGNATHPFIQIICPPARPHILATAMPPLCKRGGIVRLVRPSGLWLVSGWLRPLYQCLRRPGRHGRRHARW